MTEAQMQEQLATIIRLRYPRVIFHSDFGSGTKLTMGQAIRQKKLNGGIRAFPDLQICTARKGYNGFFLELKKDGVKIVTKSGTLVANEHIREQYDMLERLRKEGYYAEFGIGIDDCLKQIDEYLKD